jgi:hypothetical protein
MTQIPTMTPKLQSVMFIDAFHGDQESTLQIVFFKEFTLLAEPLLLARIVDDNSFSLAAAIGYLCDWYPV